jgi:hypothetical protein
MRLSIRLTMSALVFLTVAGCRTYKRQRRPRTDVPVVAKEDDSPKPPPHIEQPPPPPPRPTARAVEPTDKSPCGPIGRGPHFAVHGVDAADTLNVRLAPDPESEVLGQLLPSTTGVADLGRTQKVGPSTWRKVRCGALIGWVNERFLAPDASAGRKATARM